MTEKRVALIIATDQYEDKGLSKLISPAHDAAALAGILREPGIGGFEVKTLLNETSHRIRREIEAFFIDRNRDDLLLLYFSCHGIKDEDGRLYYSTTDTDRKLLRATAIESGFVNDIMQRSRSRKQVLLLDCCYSGAFARGMVAKADKKVITRNDFDGDGKGRVVLTASDAMQYSFEGDQVGGEGIPSVFTGNLVHGLKTGEADLDADGHITIDELYDYVHDRVVDATPGQRPAKWNFDVQGRIAIARNPNPIVKPVELSQELQETMKDNRPMVRKGAVYELGQLLRSKDKGLALSALNALKLMRDEDSRSVSVEVTKILDEYEKLQSEKKAVAEAQPVIVDTGEGTPQNIGTTAEKPVSVDKVYIEPQERMSAGQKKEVESSPQLPIKKEEKSISVSTKKSKLIWIIPVTVVPICIVLAFLAFSYMSYKQDGQRDLADSQIKLRSQPIQEYSRVAAEIMVKDKRFFDMNWNKASSGFPHHHVVQKEGKTVYDDASGLMWQQSGSTGEIPYVKAQEYIDALNSQSFAGYHDWRLPTLEEAMSLMEPTKMNGDLYIDPKFDNGQRWIWTADLFSASSAWVVNFDPGSCNNDDFKRLNYVRAVRCGQSWIIRFFASFDSFLTRFRVSGFKF